MTACETHSVSKSFEQFLPEPGNIQALPPSPALESGLKGPNDENEAHIILPGGSVTITEAAGKIFTLIGKEQKLFIRGGRVHEIASTTTGVSNLEPITPSQFRSRLEYYGRLFTWRTGANGEPVLKPVICPEETAKVLLDSPQSRERLPSISILSACPVLANDNGKVRLLGRGWHSLCGGIFVTGGESPPSVSIEKATKTLCDLLIDFDFPSPGDRSRALASLIGPGLRFGGWLADPLPLDIGEADASQSGKTYRQKLVAAVYNEKCNVVVQRNGGVGGLDEDISQKLIDGRPFVLFDNLRGKLNSPYLESILTAPATMPARVPHRGEVQVDPRGFVFQMTSNGFEATLDLANRASIMRIRKRPAGHAFKVYPAGDVHAYAVANQPMLLGCVFAVINKWVEAGKQRTSETRHDFREWAQVLDWIVQNIFHAAPLMDGHEEAKQRVGDPGLTWIRALCIALRDANESGEFSASRIAEFCISREVLPANTRQDIEKKDLTMAIGKIMGRFFGSSDEREIDGFTVRRSSRYLASVEKDGKFYRFDESTTTSGTTGPAKPPIPPEPITLGKQGHFSESSGVGRDRPVVKISFKLAKVAPPLEASPPPSAPVLTESAAQTKNTRSQPVDSPSEPESYESEVHRNVAAVSQTKQ